MEMNDSFPVHVGSLFLPILQPGQKQPDAYSDQAHGALRLSSSGLHNNVVKSQAMADYYDVLRIATTTNKSIGMGYKTIS
ncbi:hypothetical protein D3C72_1437250 [compost metagenome]